MVSKTPIQEGPIPLTRKFSESENIQKIQPWGVTNSSFRKRPCLTYPEISRFCQSRMVTIRNVLRNDSSEKSENGKPQVLDLEESRKRQSR